MVSRRVQALLDQLRAQGIQDEQVLNALAAVPREKSWRILSSMFARLNGLKACSGRHVAA